MRAKTKVVEENIWGITMEKNENDFRKAFDKVEHATRSHSEENLIFSSDPDPHPML